MQKTRQQTYKQYVLAGNNIVQHERIAVSSHVNVENRGEMDSRDPFIAGEVKKAGATVSLKWALMAFLLCAILCFVFIGGKIALTESLKAEYAQLGARYQAAVAERDRLNREFGEKSDASDVCYYAVNNLGMRLAGYEETIGVQAAGLPYDRLPATFRGSASNGQ